MVLRWAYQPQQAQRPKEWQRNDEYVVPMMSQWRLRRSASTIRMKRSSTKKVQVTQLNHRQMASPRLTG